MLRSKILGQDPFSPGGVAAQRLINYDLGDFSIGAFDDMIFDDAPIPPPKLWIRTTLEFIPCPPITVTGPLGNFTWDPPNACQAVHLTPAEILYAQPDYRVERAWEIAPDQEALLHQFATAPLISPRSGLCLWPCGAAISQDPLKIEQLLVQTDGRELYVNPLSAWQQQIQSGIEAVFEQPAFQDASLAQAIACGKFSTTIHQNGWEFRFLSLKAEPSCDQFIDILWQRND